MIRKNTRFRIYVLLLTLSYVGGVSFLLNRQAVASARRLRALESSFEKRLDELRPSFSDRTTTTTTTATTTGDSSSSPPRYFVLGSGRSGRWGYVDILFPDQSKNRYYFRCDVKRDLDAFSDRLALDSYLHSVSSFVLESDL